MSARSTVFLLILAILALVASSSLFIITEKERAIKLRLGEIVEGDLTPGLHFKMPLIDSVRIFDGRVQTLDARPQKFLTLGKKGVIVDSFVKWRISQADQFYKATSGDPALASSLLTPLVENGLRNEFGERTLHEVVSGERDELMQDQKERLDKLTRAKFGLAIIDVRVKGIDLPEEVSSSVFGRMATEREREAREYRSKGKELAEGIRADADRQKTIIEANAYKDAQTIRGEGDALAASIYAQAYSKDPEFFSFVRSLRAYKESFATEGNLMLLEPDSDFFKYMQQQRLSPAQVANTNQP